MESDEGGTVYTHTRAQGGKVARWPLCSLSVRVCVYVCVRGRERERSDRTRATCRDMHMCEILVQVCEDENEGMANSRSGGRVDDGRKEMMSLTGREGRGG